MSKEIIEEIDNIIVSLINLKDMFIKNNLSNNVNPKSYRKGRFTVTNLPSNYNKEDAFILEKGGQSNKYRKSKKYKKTNKYRKTRSVKK